MHKYIHAKMYELIPRHTHGITLWIYEVQNTYSLTEVDTSLFRLQQYIHPLKIISPFTTCVTSLAALVTAANPLTDRIFPNQICQQRIRHWIRVAFRIYAHLQSSVPFDIYMSLIHMVYYSIASEKSSLDHMLGNVRFLHIFCMFLLQLRYVYTPLLLTRFPDIFFQFYVSTICTKSSIYNVPNYKYITKYFCI